MTKMQQNYWVLVNFPWKWQLGLPITIIVIDPDQHEDLKKIYIVKILKVERSGKNVFRRKAIPKNTQCVGCCQKCLLFFGQIHCGSCISTPDWPIRFFILSFDQLTKNW